MASENTFPRSLLARTYPEDSSQHAAALMRDFDAIALAMNKISQGVTEGISKAMKDLPEDTTSDIESKSIAQDLTREMSNALSMGVPRRVFDDLHQSFSELNSKLASRVETNITPEYHDSDCPFDHGGTSRLSPSVSASAQSLGLYDFCEDRQDALEPSEGQNVVDRCCVCSTLASEEELMTTPCCLRAVGSICFEERLQETGDCCLCQAHQPRSESRSSAAPLESASGYKVHFTTESYQHETENKAEVEMARANSFEPEGKNPTGNAVADNPPRLPDASKALIANITANKETEVLGPSGLVVDIETMRTVDDRRKRSKYDRFVNLGELKKFSRDYKLHTPVPKDLVPFLSQKTARQQVREPAKNAQRKAPGVSAQISTIVNVPSTKLQVLADSEERSDHSVTKSHILKLIDQDVTYHLQGVHEEDLLDFVHSSLKNGIHRTACKRFFQRARVLRNGNVDLSVCSKCSQDSDLMNGMKGWPRAFESFVLTTQLQSYKVTVDHIQIGIMKILRDFERSTTIQTLINDNTSVLTSLKISADIRGICWNKKISGLKPIESTSITVTFATAQQANEAIEHGLLWNHERRLCRKQGAHPRIIQCGHCQAYGHISKDCSSAPRCRLCAGMHLSTACIHDTAANKACLKCALCGGAHEAMNEICKSRTVERQRLQLENRFYPTGAVNFEEGGTAGTAGAA